MNWLRTLVNLIQSGFSYLLNGLSVMWDSLARWLATAHAKIFVVIAYIASVIYAILHQMSAVIQIVRPYIYRYGQGVQQGDIDIAYVFDVGETAVSWIYSVNWVVPIDEMWQSALVAYGIVGSILLAFSLVRLVKTLIGGWI